MSKLICYCFGYSDTDIEKDVARNKGQSSILREITDAREKGRCQCEIKNPRKR